MKKILTASLVAMMAVTAANANIASTKYVDDRTGTATFTADSIKGSANLTAAVETLAGTVATNASDASAAANQALTDAKAYTDALENGAVADNAAAIADMDLASVGADGSYIKTVSQADGKVTAVAEAADAAPTPDSTKMVTSGGVYTAIEAAKTAASGANSALADRVGANEQAISTLNTEQDTQDGKISALETSLASGATKQAIDAAKKAGDDAQATIDAYKTANDKALADGLALKEDKANKVTETYDENSEVQYPSMKLITKLFNDSEEGAAADLTELENTIGDRILAEENARKAADSTLQGAIDAINNDSTGVLATAKKYADDQDAAQTTTLQGEIATAKSGAESTAKAYTDTEIAKIDTAYKAADATLQGAIDAINNAESGILADAKKYADDQDAAQTTELQQYADQAEADAIAAAKSAGDSAYAAKSYEARVEGNETNISAIKTNLGPLDVKIPAACAAGETCSLVMKKGQVAWEVISY